MNKVLVIGGGGREHAIVDALSRSPQVSQIFCAPGNAGIAAQATLVNIKDTDVEGLLQFAKEQQIDDLIVINYPYMINSSYYVSWLNRLVGADT